MNENELSTRMNVAVQDEPPLSFDPDSLVDKAFRRQRNRRAMFASAAAVVMIVLAAGAIGVSGWTGGSDVARPSGPIAGPDCGAAVDELSAAEEKRAVEKAMDRLDPVLTDHLPGEKVEISRDLAVQEREIHGVPSWDAIGIPATLLRDTERDTESVNVAIARPGTALNTSYDWVACHQGKYAEDFVDRADQIHQEWRPDGSVLRQYRIPWQTQRCTLDEQRDIRLNKCGEYVAMHFRTNGVIVAVKFSSVSKKTSDAAVEPLIAIATDRRLTF